MENRLNYFFVLLLFCLGSIGFSQKIQCKDLKDLRNHSLDCRNYLGELIRYEQNSPQYNYFYTSTYKPSYVLSSFISIDSLYHPGSDSVDIYYYCNYYVAYFDSESGGTKAYKKLKHQLIRCLGPSYKCEQYDENPFQTWCNGKNRDETWLIGMGYEHLVGNGLQICYMFIERKPLN